MTLAPWRPLLSGALHRNRARVYCRYLQLATIGTDGKPSNRTVVFRGFVDNYLQMVTDGRSEKVNEILACPWAEACWYFTVTREQFRIAGPLTLVGPNDTPRANLRRQAWQSLSKKAQQQFYWPHPGQLPTEDTEVLTDRPPCSDAPPDSFYGLLLQPERVDHLNLKGNPQDRHLYEWSGKSWTVKEINP